MLNQNTLMELHDDYKSLINTSEVVSFRFVEHSMTDSKGYINILYTSGTEISYFYSDIDAALKELQRFKNFIQTI